MVKYITTLILFLIPATISAKDFVGVPRDKLLHASVSFVAQTVCTSLTMEVMSKTMANLTCFAAVNAAGVAVESGLLGRNTFDKGDIAANVIGSGAGAIIVGWRF